MHHNYVAYVRAYSQLELDNQCELIEQYAKQHHLKIVETYCDLGPPISGLHHAMEALEGADGLIVTDLDRLVTHTIDRLRDLRPLLHKFCSASENRHLISISEGIDTGTAIGQANAMELVMDMKSAV